MSYGQTLQVLGALLHSSRGLWQVKAFECHHLPWEAHHPTLAKQVWQIGDDDIDAIDVDTPRLLATLLPALTHDLNAMANGKSASAIQAQVLLDSLGLLSGGAPDQELPHAPRTAQPQASHAVQNVAVTGLADEVAPHFSAHIKGRKWQQISAFTQAIADDKHDVLEWCAGKGHLGRLIAKAQQRSVTSLEWQSALCDSGQAFAQQWSLPQRFVCADAFSPDAARLLKPAQQAVALHACGDLHVALLQQARCANTASLAISPCCYHLIRASHYQPLSQVAQQSGLNLSRHDLQLPLQHSVIANDKATELRHKEVAWRLGFDSLQREVSGHDHYLPIPSVKQSQLNGDFKAFCLWAAAQKGVSLPVNWPVEHYLALGYRRQRLTRRIDLVAHLFRDVLEQWLLLDRVCFLEDAGYQVKLTTFCDKQITPRNYLILAQRHPHD